MDPNASIGRDDDRNSAVRPRMSVRLSSASALRCPDPPRRRDDQGDSGERVSRLRTCDSDDDDVSLQSVISQSGERPVLMPREGAGIILYDLALYEGPNGEAEQENASAVRMDDVRKYLGISVAARGLRPSEEDMKTISEAEAERGLRPYEEDMKTISEAENGDRPSSQDKKSGSGLKRASSKERDEDMFVSREDSGSNPLPMKEAVAAEGGVQRPMPPFGDKPITHRLELAPAREQGPENLAGHRGAVPAAVVEEKHDGRNQHDTFQVHSQRIGPSPVVEDEQQESTVEQGEHAALTGAYPVDGIHARENGTKECHHQDKTTLPYVFIDCDKVPTHSVIRFAVFLWVLCGVFAHPRKGVLVSISV